MKVRAPAKLNIRLKVIGRRPNGYHELISIMVPVGLFDLIELNPNLKQGVRLSCSGLFVPDGSENLAGRACRAFFHRTGRAPDVSIRLVKNIPVAAGLGGGSSNAASILMSLNEMFSAPLSFSELKDLALGLGADVPFFLYRRPCIARGIGEVLEPIVNWPKFWYVIVMPPIAVSTAWVYANLKLELTKDKYNANLHNFLGDFVNIADLLENDLEAVTAAHYPVIGSIKKALLEAGAKGALMSGSGPSVFGVFESENHARRAERRLVSQALGTVYVVSG